MRDRLRLLVLLGSALVFLASLYLPWQVAPRACNASGNDCFSVSSPTAWSSGVGDAAAVIAIALIAATAAALARPKLAHRLPLAAGGIVAAYLGIAAAALFRARPALYASFDHGVRFHWGYGVYVGVASGIASALAAVAHTGRRLLPTRFATALAGVLGLALLVAFLLPWRHLTAGHTTFDELGILGAPAVLAAVAVALGVTQERGQLLFLLGAGLFALGAFDFGEPGYPRAYGYWLALGLTLALVGVALVGGRETLRSRRPLLPDALLAGAAAVFVGSLFLRWDRLCEPHAIPGIGRCLATNGWGVAGSTAAVLASLAVVGLVLGLRVMGSTFPAVGTALLVATAGFTTSGFEPPFHRSYGAYVGFAAAGVFLALALARRARLPFDGRRLITRAVPIAAALACLAAIAVVWWAVLPEQWQRQAGVLTGWLAAVGLLLGLRILWLWLEETPAAGGELVLTPLALLAVVAAALVWERNAGVRWGGGILVGLCLFLAAVGWAEETGRLSTPRIPEEIWRIDRLSRES